MENENTNQTVAENTNTENTNIVVESTSNETDEKKEKKAFEFEGIEPLKSEEDMIQKMIATTKKREETLMQNKFQLDAVTPIKREPADFRVAAPGIEGVLINIGGRNNRPMTTSGRGAFRILGFYASKAEARNDIAEWSRDHPWIPNDCTIHWVPICKWALIARSWENQNNADYVLETIDAIVGRHYDTLQENQKEFEENVREGKTGKVSEKVQRGEEKEKRIKNRKLTQDELAQKAKAQIARMKNGSLPLSSSSSSTSSPSPSSNTSQNNNNTNTSVKARTWPKGCETRGQNVAVISVVKDNRDELQKGIEKDAEDVVRFYGAFESDEKAQEWIDNTALGRVKYFDLDIVDMYQWKTPHTADVKQATEKFRNPALQDLVNQTKTEAKKIDSFEAWCSTEDGPKPENILHSSGAIYRSEAAKKPAMEMTSLAEGGKGAFTIGKEEGPVYDQQRLQKQNAASDEISQEQQIRSLAPIDMTARDAKPTLAQNIVPQSRKERRTARLNL